MNRQILTASALTLAFCLGYAAPASAGGSDLWFHLTVDEHRGKQAQVKIHLPLGLVERLAPLAVSEIDSDSRFRINRRELTAPEAREMWRALRESGNAPFIDIRSGREQVRITRRGGSLHLQTVGNRHDGERVSISIPESVVDALLSGDEEEYQIAAALRAMARQGVGDLVQIESDDADIRVWIDGSRPAED